MKHNYEYIKVMIAEDDDNIKDNIAVVLQSFPQVDVVASYNQGIPLLEAFAEFAPDVVFLDIKMQDIDGLSLAARLREINPDILLVFVTAHTEFAATAYQLDAVDYLVKPVTREAIERAVNRIGRRFRKNHSSEIEPILAIKNKHEMYFIHKDEIIYMEKQFRKTRIYTVQCEYETGETLSALVEKLPDHFFRCHKSFVVNIKRISRICPIADRSYSISFHNYDGQVIMGRKAFENLCSLINKD